MNYRCLTNNPMVYTKNTKDVEIIEGNPLDLFKITREEILKGYKLITHPLTSSLPPNVNPYKTLFLSLEIQIQVDIESLNIIEKAIKYTQNLIDNKPIPNWDEESLIDFQFVDLDLIKNLLPTSNS